MRKQHDLLERLDFRRPVKPEEVDRCLALYDLAEKEGERFENCVKMAIERILVAPLFLFRVELDNRPDWISIPVAGISRLLEAA